MRSAWLGQALCMSFSFAYMADFATKANLQSLQKVPGGFG
jgi:hypothetical protein